MMFVTLSLLLLPGPVRAQSDGAPLDEVVGQRVRVWTPDGRRLEGTLLDAEGSVATVEVLDERGVTSMESVEVARAQVYGGQRRRISEGVLLGAVGGAALGGLLYALEASGSGGTYVGFSISPWFVAGAFAVVGAPVGLLVGASHRSDVWREHDPFVGAPAQVRAPGGAVVDIGLRIPLR
jgi:hypothetical protein